MNKELRLQKAHDLLIEAKVRTDHMQEEKYRELYAKQAELYTRIAEAYIKLAEQCSQ